MSLFMKFTRSVDVPAAPPRRSDPYIIRSRGRLSKSGLATVVNECSRNTSSSVPSMNGPTDVSARSAFSQTMAL